MEEGQRRGIYHQCVEQYTPESNELRSHVWYYKYEVVRTRFENFVTNKVWADYHVAGEISQRYRALGGQLGSCSQCFEFCKSRVDWQEYTRRELGI